MEEEELISQRTKGKKCSCSCTSCECNIVLPQPKRPFYPVDSGKYELLECFPCYFQATWILDKFPFLRWLLSYKLKWLISDVIAGLTVGLMVVPQALAYARIANLPPSYGLYSSFMGCFVYMIFGTSKDITLGPTAILSLLTASITEACDPNPDSYDKRILCAVTLTFLSGAIQLALGILNLGFLVDFIPVPVISGFTSAAAIVIALGQVKSLLGIKARRPVIEALTDIVHNIPETKGWDVLLGLSCIALVVALKLVKWGSDKYVEKKRNKMNWPLKILFKFIWLVCTARNAVVVFIAALIGFLLTKQPWFKDQLSLIDSNHSVLPDFSFPDPSPAVCTELGVGIIAAPLISFLESIAIAKAFARKNGYQVQPSQELVALGMCNLASSFVGSYPVTGSFSRTAVNAQSGVRTPAAGIVTGSVVILAIALLGDVFHYIPTASLAAIIIAAVIPVVDPVIVWKIIRLNFIDVLPLVVSFFLTLFLNIEYGVPVAILVYVIFILYRHARPRHEVRVEGSSVIFRFNGGWTYPGVNYILKRITTEVTTVDHDDDRQRTKQLVLDCSAMPDIDYTIVQELRATCEDLHHMRITIFIVGAQNQVYKVLEKARIKHVRYFDTMEDMTRAMIEDGNLLHESMNRSGEPLRGNSIQRESQ